MTSQLI